MEVRAGEAEVLEVIIVSDAVEGTFVDLDGEQVVDMPVPQPIHQKHISDDLASAASS